MQHTQFNFSRSGTKPTLAAILFLAAIPAFAATMAHPSKPDPLLDGGPTDPCMARSEYAPGRDAEGHSVTPVDVGQARVPVPDQIAVPVNRKGAKQAYVGLDGQKLDPLLNPPPCH